MCLDCSLVSWIVVTLPPLLFPSCSSALSAQAVQYMYFLNNLCSICSHARPIFRVVQPWTPGGITHYIWAQSGWAYHNVRWTSLPFCLGPTNFTVRILEKPSAAYPLYTIKQLLVLPFLELFSKGRLNKVVEKDGRWADFWLGVNSKITKIESLISRRCRHTITQSRRFSFSGEFDRFSRSRHQIRGY